MAAQPRTPSSRTLAQGPDWAVWEVNCTLGPQDRPFEERHLYTSISAVLEGTFQYRSSTGSALLYPGSFLLGNAGACFECGHEHGTGDRCVAFGFSPSLFEEIAASSVGTSRFRFKSPILPSVAATTPALVDIEALVDDRQAKAVEELAISVAERVVSAASGARPRSSAPSSRDQRRIGETLRFIEAHYSESLDLQRLAAVARMSKYHFLRMFRREVGLTPHQYLLAFRLRRSATRLRATNDAVADVALGAGFGDLSTFYERFRKVFGVAPGGARRFRR